jgi:hypothetical protein
MPTTAKSSTRVKAALLSSVSVNIAEPGRVLMWKGFNVRRSLKGWYLESLVGFVAVGIDEITITVGTLKIYIVNTSLKCKY